MIWTTILMAALSAAAEQHLYEAESLFPPEPYHNHSSSIVETLQGDLLACWFHARGERNDDTLVISRAQAEGRRAMVAAILDGGQPGSSRPEPRSLHGSQRNLKAFG